MSKRISLVLISILAVGILVIIFTSHKIEEVANIKYEDITKIVFSDGRGGRNKPLTVEDKEKIKEFIGYMDSYVVIKVKNPGMSGWIHSARFYDNDKEIMKITFVNPVIINNSHYLIIKGVLNTEKIDRFLKSVNPSWESL